MNNDIAEKEKIAQQEARSKLRESFLKSVMELNGESCKVTTYEKSSLSASFGGWKKDGTEILFTSVETPNKAKLSSALIRTPDIIAIQFDNPLLLP